MILQKLLLCLQTIIIRYYILGLFHFGGFLTFYSLSDNVVLIYQYLIQLPCLFLQDVDVNLIITDYCMPGMTGYDLLRKIKVSYKE